MDDIQDGRDSCAMRTRAKQNNSEFLKRNYDGQVKSVVQYEYTDHTHINTLGNCVRRAKYTITNAFLNFQLIIIIVLCIIHNISKHKVYSIQRNYFIVCNPFNI